MIFTEIVSVEKWWLLVLMLILMCVVLYSIWSRSLRLSYHSNQDEVHLSAVDRRLSYIASLPLVVAVVLGLWQPQVLVDAVDNIVRVAPVVEEVVVEELEPAVVEAVETVETVVEEVAEPAVEVDATLEATAEEATPESEIELTSTDETIE
jgi:hypothetical protein